MTTHGYGLWLQCSGCHRMQNHRFPKRTPDRYTYKLPGSLQRPFSYSDHSFSIFYGRLSGVKERYNLNFAIFLTGLILLGIGATLFSSLALSKTLLRGMPSSFTLELPPYRKPQFGKVIVRSVLDRTLFVLGRALLVAAPAGLIIWMLANIQWSGISLLAYLSGFLEPLGRLLGMDGIILTGFILGFPANEIVIPIVLMAYLQTGQLVEMSDQAQLFSLLSAHGWTAKTAVCMAVFSLFHWPCSTTCLTIRKETGSWLWTLTAFLLPTFIGMGLCFVINLILS